MVERLMTQVDHASPSDQVVVTCGHSSKQCLVLHPKQKSVSGMEDIVTKFSNAIHMEVDPYVGSLTTVKPYWMLSKILLFVRCEIDVKCFISLAYEVVKTIGTQFPRSEKNISGGPEVVQDAQRFMTELNKMNPG